MKSERPVLLIIDVQKGFEDPKWGTRNNPDAEKKIKNLLDCWREREWPVIHVQHVSQSLDSPLNPNQPGFGIKELVKPLPREPIIHKKVNSAFIGTDLEKRLRVEDFKTLVVTGLTTNHCVSTTTRMASNLGFETYLVADATAAFDQTDYKGNHYSAQIIHDISLANIHGEFATVVDSFEMLNKLKE